MKSTRVGWWLLAVVVIFISIATLLPVGGSGATTEFCILCGDRGLADFIANVLLFVPFGVAAGLAGASFLHVLVAGALFSLGIEAAQLELVTGRDANLGDLLSNSLGAVIGWFYFRLHPWRAARASGYAHAQLTAAVLCALLIVTLRMFAQAAWVPPYSVHWTPDYENHDVYRGKLLYSRIGGNEAHASPAPLEPPDSVQDLLADLKLDARIVISPPTHGVAPILAVFDAEREVLLLGSHGNEMVVRHWSIAEDLRLDKGDLRIPDAFTGLQAGDTVDLSLAVNKRKYCIGIDGRTQCGPGLTVGDTWSVLISPDLPSRTLRVVAAMWVFLVFVLVGFVVRDARVLVTVIAGVLVYLAAGPVVVGFAVTPLPQLVAAVVGVLAGFALSGLVVRLRK